MTVTSLRQKGLSRHLIVTVFRAGLGRHDGMHGAMVYMVALSRDGNDMLFGRRFGSCVMALVIATLILAAGLVVYAPSARAALTPAWTTERSMGDARSDAVVAQDESGLVYVAGGTIVNRTLGLGVYAVSRANTYAPSTGEWNSLPRMPVGVTFATGTMGVDGRLYVISGYNYTTGLRKEVQIYDPMERAWSLGAPIPVGVLYAKTAATPNGQIVVFGGWDFGGRVVSSAVQIYDPSSDSWSSGMAMPESRMAGQLAVVGSWAYYIGGLAVLDGLPQTNCWMYNMIGDYWYTAYMPSLPRGLAHGQGLAGPDQVLYVFGGTFTRGWDVPTDSGYYMDWKESAWEPLPRLNVGSSYGGVAFTSDGRILVLGGHNGTMPSPLSRVESLRVMTGSVSVSPTSVRPGEEVMVTVSWDFAYLVPVGYECTAYLREPDSGIVYEPKHVSLPLGSPFAFQVRVPSLMSPGPLELVVDELSVEYQVQSWTAWLNLPDALLGITVVAGYTLEEQLEMMEANLTALQETLAELLSAQGADIETLQDQVQALQDLISVLRAKIVAMGAVQNATLDQLQEQLDQLQEQLEQVQTQLQAQLVEMGASQNATLDQLQEQLDDVGASAESSKTWSMVGMALALMAVVLLALVLVTLMRMRPPSPPAP